MLRSVTSILITMKITAAEVFRMRELQSALVLVDTWLHQSGTNRAETERVG